MQEKIKQLIFNLSKRHMKGYYVENKEELHILLKKLTLENSKIGCGDSVSLTQMGVYDFFRNGDYHFNDKYDENLSKSDKEKLYIDNFSSDTFISGTNAVTENGELFNIDGNGSRIAPIIYGPKQVIIVIGTNKIVKDVNHAIKRTRQVAAPLDAKRLNKHTPCTSLDSCVDCRHKERICNDFVLITGQFIKDRIKVIIVNQDLGY